MVEEARTPRQSSQQFRLISEAIDRGVPLDEVKAGKQRLSAAPES